jgi:gliding motility-associated-like protein
MTDAAGCVIVSEVIVTEPEPLSSESFVEDALCYNDPSGTIDFYMAGGTPPYQYGWISGQTQSRIDGLPAGEYYVLVQDINECLYDTTLIVGHPDSLRLDPETLALTCPDSYDGEISLSPNGGTAPYSLTWEDGSPELIRTELAPGLYIISLTDAQNCVTVDSVELISEAESCIEIPTAFTPNADGFNDLWEIEGMIYYPEATMKIFNRWGELIYETQNYFDRPWDGRHRGTLVPIDSYHFIITFTNGNSEITGHVTVIR